MAMAALASAGASPRISDAASTEETRKPRKNPARRKAAKARAEAQAQAQSPGTDGLAKPSPPPSDGPSIARRNTAAAVAATPTRPALKTAKSQPSPAAKPTIARRTTAPARSSPSPPKSPVSPSTSIAASSAVTSRAVALPGGPLAGPALLSGGLVGCAASAAVLLGTHMWHDVAGPESAILAARAAKLCVANLSDEVIAALRSGAYTGDDALDALRRATLAHLADTPGPAAPAVERIFRELALVRRQRGSEGAAVLAAARRDLERASRAGASNGEMQALLLARLMMLSTFAGNAAQDVVARNPRLRPLRDGAIRTLQGPPLRREPTVRVNMEVRQTHGVRV